MTGMAETAGAKLVRRSDRIHCSGQEGGGGHPKVFLRLRNGKATCPYCGRRFIADSEDDPRR